ERGASEPRASHAPLTPVSPPSRQSIHHARSPPARPVPEFPSDGDRPRAQPPGGTPGGPPHPGSAHGHHRPRYGRRKVPGVEAIEFLGKHPEPRFEICPLHRLEVRDDVTS